MSALEFSLATQIEFINRVKLTNEEVQSLVKNQAFVNIMILVKWTVLQNVQLETETNNQILVMDTIPSMCMFVQHDGKEHDPARNGEIWRTRYRAGLRTLLVPTHIPSERGVDGHYVLVIIDLITGQVEQWDSLGERWDRRIRLERINSFLSKFLPHNVPRLQSHGREVSRQSGTNCGIFCIEFIRAYVAGFRPGPALTQRVSEGKMAQCRASIMDEITSGALVPVVPVKVTD